jgi:hypothetical protein
MTPERRLEILIRTRALIADEHRWGQGTLSRHPLVDRLMMRPPRLCLMGAIMVAATGSLTYTAEVWDIDEFLIELIPERERVSAHGQHAMAYNDRHSHSDIVFLLDTAIFHTQCEIELRGATIGLHASAQDEQHQRDDREDDQNRPQHSHTRSCTPIAGS